MGVLDDADHVLSIDKSGMLAEIAAFADNAEKAIIDSLRVELKGYEFDSVVVAGMGGSAVGGLLLCDWLLYSFDKPMDVSRGYHLPGWVKRDTLVLAVSYSGNTEETLSQYHEAKERGCNIICFCSGGELEELARKDGNPVVGFPSGIQPRAAIPFQFFSLAAVAKTLGIVGDEQWMEVLETLSVTRLLCESMGVEVPVEENMGKQLAGLIEGYIPFVYAPRCFQAVAYRYGTQFNENSKSPAASSFFPEMFHNSVMAREGPEDILGKACAVIIRDPATGGRLGRKIEVTLGLLSEGFGRVVDVEAVGEALLTRMMSALLIGDFTSAYLGVLYGVDPSSTDSIGLLKASV